MMNAAQSLQEKNIRPSLLRIKILEYLISVKTHPTVDEIYDKLLPEIPTLSKTTVYNTLKLLVEAGLSKAITIEGQQMRYDGDTSLHGHFRCESCGRIVDFPIEDPGQEALQGFEVHTKEVYYSGNCNHCLGKNMIH